MLDQPLFWIGIALCWSLFFWPWRQYRLDYFRLRLFVLRDELFDLAADGAIPFDHPAYELLRNSLNSNIRFGHKHGLLDVLCHLLLTNWELSAQFSRKHEAAWEEALQTLDAPLQQKLRNMRSQMELEAVEQIVFTSFILTITLLAAVFCILLWVAKNRTARLANRAIRNERLQSYLFAGEVPALKVHT